VRLSDALRAYATFEDRTTDPATPTAGTGLVYFKDGKLHQRDSAGVVTDLTESGGGGGGGGGVPFKRTVITGTGNKTTSSTTWTAVDATNLGYLTLELAVGDIVRCILTGQSFQSSTNSVGYNFEVDRPASANT
jgi:hypothetical protein